MNELKGMKMSVWGGVKGWKLGGKREMLVLGVELTEIASLEF